MTTLHDTTVRGFASDNYSGVHPEVLAAIAAAGGGHQTAYGDDVYTARLQEVFAHHFGGEVEAFPVFNGTGANVTGLQSMLPRWGAVIAASTAHINVDEGGAPERVAGIKLLTVPTDDGKLTPELVDREAWGWGDEHRAQPLVVSITQSTELGTLYTPDEIRALADHAHARGMRLHLDGARIANAAAALDLPLRAFTRDAGVDVLSFGGTKNGAMLGEAIVVLDPAASEGLRYLRKLNMQLSSKMRFVSAQLIALLERDLWLRSARHANAMAARLRAGVEAGIADGSIRGVAFTQPTQVNGVFATLPDGVADQLRESFRFYDWDAARREVRWMCSFDTQPEDVDAFVAELARLTRG
ncbi:low specificity L-threonine aldolase [Microbacterium sp. zg.Y1090]|uniref:threonine aldolase family protein n=1 Tax=Microbacterium TaxID=33882 RepID=UPI00214B72F5|nr:MULTISPECIES: low specificity L-threonine aldolase [unclassified Microbacterium]MCR2813776.1 low specificity L-threonine aldolase [Microbacterium sp. zg.Y1084]MCR2819710.1 low specificity L-threonine aldolase [Microbacterium sp. zg.Y1090]MDL5487558.1 low specificity L-threonine aldolase [Microbacterium sp. zg-Y1211]WIM28046.1 low specificity L-threonine aldolase [Microbacterium sp. zg-Y1090]